MRAEPWCCAPNSTVKSFAFTKDENVKDEAAGAAVHCAGAEGVERRRVKFSKVDTWADATVNFAEE